MTLIKADGAAGERWASSILGIAACSENANTTMDEDAAKVDMKLSFRDVFRPKSLITVHAQIKSGKSFRAASSNSKILTLNIDNDTLQSLRESSTLGVVLWVPPKPHDRIYWYAQDPRRPIKTPAKLSKKQFITPSIRYDLSRLCFYSNWTQSFSMQTVKILTAPKIMRNAKSSYKELKKKEIFNPIVGNLAVTRMAWRHVTRRSKTTKRRLMSLRVVPYLKNILDKAPDRFLCLPSDTEVMGKKTIDIRYILCWYRAALNIDNKRYSILLRIKEEITYPTNWRNQPLSTSEIKQVATLVSWWCKEDSK